MKVCHGIKHGTLFLLPDDTIKWLAAPLGYIWQVVEDISSVL